MFQRIFVLTVFVLQSLVSLGSATGKSVVDTRDAVSFSWKVPTIELQEGDTGMTLYMEITSSKHLSLRLRGMPHPFKLKVTDAEGAIVLPQPGSPETFGISKHSGHPEEEDIWLNGGPLAFSLPANGYFLKAGAYSLTVHYANTKTRKDRISLAAGPDWVGTASSPPLRLVVVPRGSSPWGKPLNGVELRITPEKASFCPGDGPILRATLVNSNETEVTLPGSVFQYLARGWLVDSRGCQFKEAKRIDVMDFYYDNPVMKLGAGASYTFSYTCEGFYPSSDSRELIPGEASCYLTLFGMYSNLVPVKIVSK